MNDTELLAKAIDRLAGAIEQAILTMLDTRDPYRLNNPDPGLPTGEPPFPTQPPADLAVPTHLQAVQPVSPTPAQPVIVPPVPVQPPGGCLTHGRPWKYVPPGVSKSTGNSYPGFWACPERTCKQRPAA